ncbi:MAG: M23 family metallopeptidase [Candidatus Leucobacter sulfamidivorax]|nr:M23 family metallopeptidase [Candidatus Leucobacter sulfamidivorax]
MSIRLVHPCPGSVRTDAFGRRTWADGSTDFHTGQDFAAPAWTPIYAAHSGRVTALWWDAYPSGAGAGGNMIKIGSAAFSTRYAHLIAYAVKAGDEVQAGQLIGYVGATGAATGNHLHFELELPGGFVDPMPYLTASIGDEMSAKAENEISNTYQGLWYGGHATIDGQVRTFRYGVLPIVAHNQELIAQLIGQQAALLAAVQQLAGGAGTVDMAVIEKAAEKGARDALAGLVLKADPQ